MHLDWQKLADGLSGPLKALREETPEVMKGFAAIARVALAPGALDAKTKELVALAVAVAVRCDDCITFHTKAAIKQGASLEEVSETLGISIYMGAGPSVMYAAHAAEAFAQFKAAAGEASSERPGTP